MKPSVTVGEFALVKGDTSPGNDGPSGEAFVVSTKGVGSAAKASAQFTEVNGRELHHNVPHKCLTPAFFGQGWTNMSIGTKPRSTTTEAVPFNVPSPETNEKLCLPSLENMAPCEALVANL